MEYNCPFVFSLNDLAEFIKVADVGLTQTVEEGDYNGLVAVMGHLMAVKDRQTVTDEMFEPLKQTIELLKTYGQEMPEEVHTQLQVKCINKDRIALKHTLGSTQVCGKAGEGKSRKEVCSRRSRALRKRSK